MISKTTERLRRVPAWLRNRFAPNGLILLYHRIADPATDSFKLCVTPQQFAEQMEVVRRYARPVHLSEAVTTIQSGKRPARMIVVTFDDGYADNLHTARPVLERFDVPATIFVATGQIESGREFWWDELEKLLLLPNELPAHLALKINNSSYEWSLGDFARYTEKDFDSFRAWNFFDADTPTPRHALYRELNELLRPLPDSEQQAALDELRFRANAPKSLRPEVRTLTRQEIARLTDGNLIEVGAHTVTHPVLARHSLAAQQHEIERSRDTLTEILNCPVRNFAYPFGWQASYTQETVSLVQRAGFTAACTTEPVAVTARTNPFRLPRLTVGDSRLIADEWNGDAFADFLKWFVLG